MWKGPGRSRGRGVEEEGEQWPLALLPARLGRSSAGLLRSTTQPASQGMRRLESWLDHTALTCTHFESRRTKIKNSSSPDVNAKRHRSTVQKPAMCHTVCASVGMAEPKGTGPLSKLCCWDRRDL